MEHKITAYADDLFFLLTEPDFSLLLLNLFTQYGELSNFSINYSKSEALNFNLLCDRVANLKQSNPFHWAPSAVKYLATNITPHRFTLYKTNFSYWYCIADNLNVIFFL